MVKYNDNQFTWTDGGMDVDSGVVSFDMRADDDNDTVISVENLDTPVDIYLPVNTSQLDLSYFTQVLVTKGATSLVSVQTGGGTNVAIKVVIRAMNISKFCNSIELWSITLLDLIMFRGKFCLN